ncbi:MAG: hypothetical protein LBF97_06075 [Elusimicrobiota bacterium]|jgi:hypothetical protein|nr:hypothetical protein [Elusimicrobiota bacterium]
MTNVIQNERAKVENVVKEVKNKVVEEATQQILKEIINLNSLQDICDDVIKDISKELHNASFMTIDLELSEKQKEKLKNVIPQIVYDARDKYIANIKKDERTIEIVKIVKLNLTMILEELLSNIGQEINRGAILNSVAVSADTKNEKVNKIELNYSKSAGDITIPTRGVFLSTNCIDVIKNSIEIVGDKNNKIGEKK